MKVSWDSDDLIAELIEDIAEFGDFKVCIWVREINAQKIITNYDFYEETKDGFDSSELESGEHIEISTAKKTLERLIEQNKIV